MLLRIDECAYRIAPNQGTSLARPLDFSEPKVDFGAAPPTRQPVQIGSFVGDTKQGAGCNVDELRIVPHCHGTHSETIGHIVNEEVPIATLAIPCWMLAALVTVPTVSTDESSESYTPTPTPGDRLITARSLEHAWQELTKQVGGESLMKQVQNENHALVIRLANESGSNKRESASSDGNGLLRSKSASTLPPYFSSEAIEWCNELHVGHLLIEPPSIDRLEDGGLLSNHHLYWNVPAETHSLTPNCWREKSITESITIDHDLVDGFYLLNLQIPRLCSDAAPSNPILHPLKYADASIGGSL